MHVKDKRKDGSQYKSYFLEGDKLICSWTKGKMVPNINQFFLEGDKLSFTQENESRGTCLIQTRWLSDDKDKV